MTVAGPARADPVRPEPAGTAALPRLIALLSLGAFGSAASMRVADAQLPELASVFGVSLGGAAQVITVFSVAYGLLQLGYGPLGDRHGKWRVIALALAGAGLASAICALAPGYETLLAARVAAGAMCAAVIPLAMAWIGDAVPYDRRQPVLARFLTGQILGMAAGQWAGGLAADYASWRVPFGLLAAWFALASLLLWRARRDALEAAPFVPGSGHLLRESAGVLREPWARVVLLTVGLEGALLFGPLAFLATHLHLQLGLSLAQAGALVTLYAAGGLLFVFGARRLLRRLGEPGLARGGATLLGSGLLGLAVAPDAWIAAALCAVCGLGFYMFHNTLQTNATQMAPQARGAAVSLFASVFFIGQTAGVAAASLLVERVGTALVIVAGALGVAAVGWGFAALRARRPAH